MKLFYTGNSPYARRARVATRASGLGARVEELDVAPLGTEERPLLALGPGAKVPGLRADAGTCLCETLIVTRTERPSVAQTKPSF